MAATSSPIALIRRSYLKRNLIVFACFAIGFALPPLAYWLDFPVLIAMIAFWALGFSSMLWFAFSSLKYTCPRCHYNLVFDPYRPFLRYNLHHEPYICPNCKMNLSEPYPPAPIQKAEIATTQGK
jgi:hypothetical protein